MNISSWCQNPLPKHHFWLLHNIPSSGYAMTYLTISLIWGNQACLHIVKLDTMLQWLSLHIKLFLYVRLTRREELWEKQLREIMDTSGHIF